MSFKSAEFVFGVGVGGEFRRDGMPEYLLVGRSNCGKSSLLNALAGHGGLARVSKVPGKTRQVNYFLINKKFYLVDLPGYGYAKLPKAERAAFARLLDSYLQTPHNRRLALLLADGRHDPMAQDLEAADWLKSRGLESRLILTKIDSVKPGVLSLRKKVMAKAFDLPPEHLYATSAHSREGVEALCRDLSTSLLMAK